MSTVSAINCNMNCICMNSDCLFKHHISYKERKIVKRFYDALSAKNIEEPNMALRKKNCTFGQLCEKENCGYKHRLSFADREKLIIAYKFNKICPDNHAIIKTSHVKHEESNMNISNSFSILDEPSKVIEVKIEIEAVINKKSWASIVKNEKPIEEIKSPIINNTPPIVPYVPLNWEDCADDDFLMEFP